MKSCACYLRGCPSGCRERSAGSDTEAAAGSCFCSNALLEHGGHTLWHDALTEVAPWEFWKDTKEYLNQRGIRKSEFFESGPSLTPFSLISPPSFPFRPCSLSHHSSPFHLPFIPPSFWVLENSDLGTPLWFRYSLVSCWILGVILMDFAPSTPCPSFPCSFGISLFIFLSFRLRRISFFLRFPFFSRDFRVGRDKQSLFFVVFLASFQKNKERKNRAECTNIAHRLSLAIFTLDSGVAGIPAVWISLSVESQGKSAFASGFWSREKWVLPEDYCKKDPCSFNTELFVSKLAKPGISTILCDSSINFLEFPCLSVIVPSMSEEFLESWWTYRQLVESWQKIVK